MHICHLKRFLMHQSNYVQKETFGMCLLSFRDYLKSTYVLTVVNIQMHTVLFKWIVGSKSHVARSWAVSTLHHISSQVFTESYTNDFENDYSSDGFSQLAESKHTLEGNCWNVHLPPQKGLNISNPYTCSKGNCCLPSQKGP